MRRAIMLGIVGWLSLTMTGCGGCGGMSQAYMRANAIRRPKDDDPPAAQQKPTPAPRKKPQQAEPPEKNPPLDSSLARTSKTPQAMVVPPAAVVAEAENPATATKPAEPLSPTERRQRSLENLKKIGAALELYAQANGAYPAAAKFAPGKLPLLSWRVEILPYLGFGQLYKKFRLNEPWDSEHNAALLSQIPAVYQSAERFDEKTNYLVPLDSSGAFSLRSARADRGTPPRRIEDGAENTIILLEASDDLAQPWTKPADLEISTNSLESFSGRLRIDGLFVVLGGGSVRLLPLGTDVKQIRSLITIDSGDNRVATLAITRAAQVEPADLSGEPPATVVNVTAAEPKVVDPLASGPGPSAVAPGTIPPARSAGSAVAPPLAKAPIPNALELEKARGRFREIGVWQEKIRQARTDEQQQQVAQGLLAQVDRLQDAPADLYVVLQEVRRLALEGRDAVTALEVVERLARRFEIDATAERVEVVSQFARATAVDRNDHEGNGILLRYAVGLVGESLANDNFANAERMYQIAMTAARRTKNTAIIRTLQNSKREVDAARTAYAKVEGVIETLNSDPDNGDANLVAGSYYCFIKGNWERGLPLLARGSDARLQELAEKELDPPALADLQLDLADQWWSLGEDEQHPQRRRMQMRGVHWYLQALPQLAGGLKKVKAEVRLKAAERVYGKTAIQAMGRPHSGAVNGATAAR